MSLPSIVTVQRVSGATQIGNTSWSPFGPQEQNLIITSYGDLNSMFNAFVNGQVDITDWPVLPENLGQGSSASYCDSSFNPDFFCTTPTGENGIFDNEINSATPFMGIPLNTSRPAQSASITTGVNTVACDAQHDSFTVTLRNSEQSGSLVLDQYNLLTVANFPSGFPSVTVHDSGGSSPNGVYNTPCLIAGTYSLTTSIYGGTAQVKTLGGQNHALTFNVYWNSISDVYPSAARTLWGAAQGHLLDVPAFVNGFFGPAATYDNFMAPPGQGLTPPTPAQLSAADCYLNGNIANPVLHGWAPACSGGSPDVSAYNMVADNVNGGTMWWQVTGNGMTPGVGYSGHSDLRAACDDFVAMGLGLSSAAGPGGCEEVANALANSTLPAPWTPSNYPHVVPNGNIVYYVRTSAGRKQFGTIIADSLNAMFGTPSSSGGGTVCYGACPNAAPRYYTIGQIACIIFGDGPGGCYLNGWQIYTGGWALSSIPDHLYALFNSLFSGGVCGAGSTTESQPNDFPFYCSPQFDTYSSAGEFSTPPTYGPLFTRAAIDGMNTAMDIPVFTQVDSFVELNGWNYQQCVLPTCSRTQSSIVNTLGSGTETPFWTLLNARQVPGYIPTNSIYSPGGRTGSSDNGLIRLGFAEGPSQLSPFQYTTVADEDIVNEIFDSMLALNPLVSAASGQLIDWQTTTHSSTFNPTATCNSPGTGPVIGCTSQIWHLRNDLKFQDGNQVTANDVAYSIKSYRDVPSANLGPQVANVATAVGLDCGPGQPCETLQVVLALQSPFYEMDIGTIPIIEKALWAPYCGDPATPTSNCASLSFNPMAASNPLTGTQGILIGDGPFSCVIPSGFPNAGQLGGPCAINSAGGLTVEFAFFYKIFLQRNNLYFRCCPNGVGATTSSLYKLSYADKNNDGIVNIQDLADAAFHYGQYDPYWVNPNITCLAPTCSTTVNIQVLAMVAFYYGAGVTSYEGASNLSTLTGIDPQIDPFNCSITGC